MSRYNGECYLTQHTIPLPHHPPNCQHWCLSAGGQTSEQTLPIREVTPLGWQARAIVPETTAESHMAFMKKVHQGRNKGVPLRAARVRWEAFSDEVLR